MTLCNLPVAYEKLRISTSISIYNTALNLHSHLPEDAAYKL